jgi:ferredoxin-nitrate reductase
MTNAERRVCVLEQATEAPGEALPDWQILCRFAAAMGHREAFAYPNVQSIFDEFKQTTAGRDLDMTGMSYDLLRASGGLQWPLPLGRSGGTKRLYADGVFPTPSGRARFHAVEYRPASEPIDADYPFVLTTGRVKDQWHTRTRTGKVKKLVAGAPEPFIEISPGDARDLGIEAGKLVEVASRRSSVRLKARITDTMRPGVLFVPFHWSRLWSAETDVNRVMNSAFDPISKEPELKYTAVNIRRA